MSHIFVSMEGEERLDISQPRWKIDDDVCKRVYNNICDSVFDTVCHL